MSTTLRVARAVKGWSRAETARLAGIPEGALWRYEHGEMKPSRNNLELLRAALAPELDRAESFYGPVETRERGALKGVPRSAR